MTTMSTETSEGNCPACEMSGWTPERVRRDSPGYYAALISIPHLGVPDGPARWCWDCRRMHAAGLDPRALSLADAAT